METHIACFFLFLSFLDNVACAGICKQVIDKLEVEGKRKKILGSSQDVNQGPSDSS